MLASKCWRLKAHLKINSKRYASESATDAIRKEMISKLREGFAHLNLSYSIGGQISFDIFPQVSSRRAFLSIEYGTMCWEGQPLSVTSFDLPALAGLGQNLLFAVPGG